MEIYLLPMFFNNLWKRDKNLWEAERLIGYITAQANSTKQLKPSDIISFGWDVEQTKDTKVTNEDKERITQRAKQLSKYF